MTAWKDEPFEALGTEGAHPTRGDVVRRAAELLLHALPDEGTHVASAAVDDEPAIVVVARGDFADELLEYIRVAQAETFASMAEMVGEA